VCAQDNGSLPDVLTFIAGQLGPTVGAARVPTNGSGADTSSVSSVVGGRSRLLPATPAPPAPSAAARPATVVLSAKPTSTAATPSLGTAGVVASGRPVPHAATPPSAPAPAAVLTWTHAVAAVLQGWIGGASSRPTVSSESPGSGIRATGLPLRAGDIVRLRSLHAEARCLAVEGKRAFVHCLGSGTGGDAEAFVVSLADGDDGSGAALPCCSTVMLRHAATGQLLCASDATTPASSPAAFPPHATSDGCGLALAKTSTPAATARWCVASVGALQSAACAWLAARGLEPVPSPPPAVLVDDVVVLVSLTGSSDGGVGLPSVRGAWVRGAVMCAWGGAATRRSPPLPLPFVDVVAGAGGGAALSAGGLVASLLHLPHSALWHVSLLHRSSRRGGVPRCVAAMWPWWAHERTPRLPDVAFSNLPTIAAGLPATPPHVEERVVLEAVLDALAAGCSVSVRPATVPSAAVHAQPTTAPAWSPPASPLAAALTATLPASLSPASQHMVQQVLPLAAAAHECSRSLAILGHPSMGGVCNAIAAATRVVLREFQATVLALEAKVRATGGAGAVAAPVPARPGYSPHAPAAATLGAPPITLQQAWFHLQPSLRTLTAAAELLRPIVGSSSGSAFPQRGGEVLATLATAVALTGNTATKALANFLLERAATPFFRHLARWLFLGEVADPCHEFMVDDGEVGGRARDGGGDMSAATWDTRFTIVPSMVPPFLAPHAQSILLAGKYLFAHRMCSGSGGGTPAATDAAPYATAVTFRGVDPEAYAPLVQLCMATASTCCDIS